VGKGAGTYRNQESTLPARHPFSSLCKFTEESLGELEVMRDNPERQRRLNFARRGGKSGNESSTASMKRPQKEVKLSWGAHQKKRDLSNRLVGAKRDLGERLAHPRKVLECIVACYLRLA